MDNVAIKISNVSKSFNLPHERQNTLKGLVINFKKRGYERQHVLSDLSFDIHKGEFLGILGRNGSGKSTLLKTISGIYSPDEGSIDINGKLTPFIELGVGFNPELSGRDNVFLNGALLGFSRTEIENIYEDIVSFAELERFMDQKLKNYSSGMQVRLAFSIAIRADTDILVLDEVLAVGDEAFQRKCYSYFNELKSKGKTVILVTHDMSAVQRFCTRAIVLSDGRIIYDGNTSSASDVYRDLNLQSTQNSLKSNNKKKSKISKNSDVACQIEELVTIGDDNESKVFYRPHEDIKVVCRVRINNSDAKNIELLIKLNNPGGTILSALEFVLDEKTKKDFSKGDLITISWTIPGIFNDGKYLLSASLKNKKTGDFYIVNDDIYEFDVEGWDMPNVLIHPDDAYSVGVEN
ncbi:MAG TPA: polysaccharide ABC transporter ATP-binding protein [Candidatus Saccharimonadales bacterium]|nr:polysaccharide ABC transporter ATP-binding protein [Candidatus Saccharimonadales bacterium]